MAVLTGTAFDDVIQGTSLADVIHLLAGNDTANGDGGDDYLLGGLGDDYLIGGLGADVLVGGNDTDTASYDDNWGGVAVSLTLGQGFGNAAQGDTYDSIENLVGSVFADLLIGDAGVNRLSGGDGDDYLVGGDGDDYLIGGLGADVLVGGNDTDTASYEDNWGGVAVNLTLGQGFGNAAQGDTYDSIENLVGSVFADLLIGNAGVNRLNGGDGDDYLAGVGGADTSRSPPPWAPAISTPSTTSSGGTDKIALDDAVFTGLGSARCRAGAFVVAAPAAA